jgi:uncharacterized LabA/DUF88 family protein
MIPPRNNYAFIDGQNLYLGIRKLGWKLDYHKFRVYLREKYHTTQAYLFVGYIKTNEPLYRDLERADFILVFKPATVGADGKIKGNIDADLVLRTMDKLDNYHKAILISSDGDFYSLAGYLRAIGKLAAVLSPDVYNCSWLLREAAADKIWFMNELRPKLGYE